MEHLNKAKSAKSGRSAACHELAVLLVAGLLVSACAPATAVDVSAVQPDPTSTSAPAGDDDEPPAVSGEARYAITGVSVVDVEQGVVIPDQTVVVVGERIVRIAPSAEAAATPGSHLVDGRGLYLMPGLVDAHVHDFDAEVFGRVLVASGVTLVRDMGMPTAQALELRQTANGGTMPWPEVIVTGVILDGTPPLIPDISLGLQTAAEARAAVQRQVAAGVDQIKVYSNLDLHLLQTIVEEADRHGLKVVGHVAEAVYLEDAVAAGQDSIEHLHAFAKLIGKLLGEPIHLQRNAMGLDFDYWPRLSEVDHAALQVALRRLADAGAAVCPTVIVFKAGVDMKSAIAGKVAHSEYISPGIRQVWRTMWASQEDIPAVIWQSMAAFVRELREAGVTLLVGTDLVFPGIIPGYAVHEEMAIWQEAGIPAADVLRSATIVPARFMGLDDRLGTVAEGKVASMVLTRANPLEDIGHAQEIEGVFLRGRYFNRADLDRLLTEARELAR